MKQILWYIAAFLLLALAACGHRSPTWQTLSDAEALMADRPDSALELIETIDPAALSGAEEKARYALLRSMALDKNYVDTTTFAILQPAISYYSHHGSHTDKLRTLYYQGRIYHNRGHADSALTAFTHALDFASQCADSMAIARAYVAQANMYYDLHDFDEYITCNLRAADIYKKLSNEYYEVDCIQRAINGAIISGNKTLVDSLLILSDNFKNLDDSQMHLFERCKLSSAIKFGTENDIKELLASTSTYSNLDVSDLLTFARAYNRLGENDRAEDLLTYIYNLGIPYDTIGHQAISVIVYKDLRNYERAFETYWAFNQKLDSIKIYNLEQRVRVLEEKHKVELKAQEGLRKKSEIIWWCVSGIVILILSVLMLLSIAHSHKSKKELAIQKVLTSELENKKLKSDKEKMAVENRNLQLEKAKKCLEAENLAHRVEILENESRTLKDLLEDSTELPVEVQQSMRDRIKILNSLLASHITNDSQYEMSYDKWMKDLTDDRTNFMNSNRHAMEVSYPLFIQHLKDHGLTIDEINYACLYALGMNGKEIGAYLKKPSHVNMSSAIRRKLGIDKHATNLSIYVSRFLAQE